VKLWAESPEFEAIKQEVTSIVDTRANLGPSGPQHKHEFAATTWTQTRLLTKRLWINYWRSPSYGYGNLFSVLSTAIAAGFTFWKLGNSQLDLQERMFAAFMFIFLPAPMMNSVLPKVWSRYAEMLIGVVFRGEDALGVERVAESGLWVGCVFDGEYPV
jgi:ATP-binding cassette, subfamily G (WHITE), member 2, SNQ2